MSVKRRVLALCLIIPGCLLLAVGGAFALINSWLTSYTGTDADSLNRDLGNARFTLELNIGSMRNADGTPVTDADAFFKRKLETYISGYPEADRAKIQFVYALLPYITWTGVLLIAGSALTVGGVICVILPRHVGKRRRGRRHGRGRLHTEPGRDAPARHIPPAAAAHTPKRDNPWTHPPDKL